MIVPILIISIVVSCFSAFLALSVALRVKKTLDPLIEEGVFKQRSDAEESMDVPLGTVLPTVGDIVDHEGRTVVVPAREDGPWVLTFQSTECAECKTQLPVYRAFLEEHRIPRERVLSVVSGARQKLDAYVSGVGDLATIVHSDDAKSLAESIGVRAWPTYLIISPEGTVIYSTDYAGALPELDLTPATGEVTV
ncbi:TlpA family protein disulfide reductase [Streptomyces ardesiacus]|uniref:TlpA family protein disulfide reductase n=1 Tax=Streptomyces ardesiacus TaxID=285564 RepID=UPI000D592793|nr:redoxin domain-containing protein [Streptomyces ardesiacus]